MNNDKEYKTQWIEEEVRHAGGAWYWRVGIVEDDNGRRRVRIAKGPIRPGGKIAQSQHVNLRPKDWAWLRETVEKMLAILQEEQEGGS